MKKFTSLFVSEMKAGRRLSGPSEEHVYPMFRPLVWLNIIVQLLFPLASAFTPVMAASADTSLTSAQGTVETRPYTLQKGETVSRVAARFHLSVPELKKINQFRIFTTPFEELRAGDEIDIPVAATPPKPQLLTGPPEPALTQWLSSNATSLAQATTGPHHAQVGDMALSQARSAAVAGSEAAVSQWLSQFGTARVQLGIDDHLSLSDSALDMLVPLYDNGRDVLFMQAGGRRHDDRTTLNAGAGVRLFRGHWMYGSNVFLDNDITGHNRRVGLGAEAWTDYLKLSVNTYLGTTDWHQSRDFEDYDERPADGFDLTASGWLPVYPQLGSTLKYEQYQGEHVGLVGKDTRQRNPKAITAGLNWTPVPLVTLGTDYRKSGGHDEMQMQARLSWNFGMSLAEQLSADKVSQSRTLASSRLDLVERNNNIVLDYRKQTLVRLSLPESLRGEPLSTQMLNAEVTAKHGLAGIDWQAPEFMAAGGKMTDQPGVGVQLQLPPYNPAPEASNTYILTGTARDTHGNTSVPATTKIVVEQGAVSQADSAVYFKLTHTAQLNVAMKPGDQYVVTVEARDARQRALRGLKASLRMSARLAQPVVQHAQAARRHADRSPMVQYAQAAKRQADGLQFDAFTEVSPGVYEATVTIVTAGDYRLTIQEGEVTLPELQMNMLTGLASKVDAANSVLAAAPETIPADNTTTTTLSFSALDTLGQPVKGLNGVTFTVAGIGAANVTLGNVAEINGVYCATLKGDMAGTAVVTVSINGQAVAGKATLVTLTDASGVNAANSQLAASPTSIPADKATPSVIAFTARDAQSLPVTGLKTVAFAVTGLQKEHFTLGPVTETNGVYSATFTGDMAGTAVVTVSVNGLPVAGKAALVTLTATSPVNALNSQLNTTPPVIPADNATPSLITLTAKDTKNNPLTGLSAVAFEVTGLQQGHFTLGKVTETNGVYRATLIGDTPGIAVITASVNGQVVAGKAATITLADTATVNAAGSQLAAAPDTIPADNATTSRISFTAVDAQNKPLTGLKTVTFNVSGITAGHVTLGNVTENNGVYSTTLKGDMAGTAVMTVSVSGQVVAGKATTVTLSDTSAVNALNSQLETAPSVIPANNTIQSRITFTAKDAQNQPVTGLKGVSFDVTGIAAGHFTLSSVSEKNGVYTATLKGDVAGTAVVTVSVSGQVVAGKAATVILTDASGINAQNSQLDTTPPVIPADNATQSLISFSAKDAQNKPLTGLKTVTFAVSGIAAGHFTLGQMTENNGVYSATLKGDIPGTAVVTVSVNGQTVTGKAATVSLTAGTTSVIGSRITVTPDTILADNASESHISLIMKDAQGQPVTGLKNVGFRITGIPGGHYTLGSVTEQPGGIYNTTLKGDMAGIAKVFPNVNGNATALSAFVTLTPVVNAASSQLNVSPATIPANNATPSTLTFTAMDAQNKPVTGLASAINFDISGIARSSVTLSKVTETNGVYSATLIGATAGIAIVTVSANGLPVAGKAATVTLTDITAVNAQNSQLNTTPSVIPADNVTPSMISFTAKDSQNRPVTGMSSQLSFDITGMTAGHYTLGSVSEQNGVYSASLTGDIAGTAVVTVSINGQVIRGKAATIILTDLSAVSAANSRLDSAPPVIPADKVTMSVISFTAKNMQNQPITGLTGVTFDVSGLPKSHFTLGTVTEKNGVYSATLKGDMAGTAIVMVNVNGVPVAGKAASVILTATSGVSIATSQLDSAPPVIPADNTTTTTLSFHAKDAQSQPVTGLTGVTFGVYGLTTGHYTLGAVSAKNGVYSASLKGDMAGTAVVMVNVDGQPLTTSVILTAIPSVNIVNSIQAVPSSIPADNQAQSILSIVMKDTHNQPMNGQKLTFNVAGLQGGHFTLGNVTESNGVYSATLKGDLPGTATVTASSNGTPVGGSTTVTLMATNRISATTSQLSAAPATIPADNTTTTTLSFSAKDAQSKALTGLTAVTFDVAGLATGHYTLGSVSEKNGVYSATLKGDAAGTAFVTLRIGGQPVAGLASMVVLTDIALVNTATSRLSTSPASIPADNTTTSTVSFIAKDGRGRPVTGLTGVAFDVSGSIAGNVTLGQVTEKNGVYSAALKGNTVGTAIIMVSVNGAAMAGQAATVALTPVVSAARSKLASTPAVIPADNATTAAVSFTALDAQGLPVTGLTTVTFNVMGIPAGHVTLDTVSERNGVYLTTLKGDMAGKATVSVSINGTPVNGPNTIVTLQAPVSATRSQVSTTPPAIPADNTTTSTVSFTALDAQGLPVTGLTTVGFNVLGLTTGHYTLGLVTEQKGIYSASLKGDMAGTAVVMVMVNGQPLAGKAATVSLTPVMDIGHSVLTAAPATIPADGTTQTVVSFTARDAQDQPVTSLTGVTFNVTGIASGHYTLGQVIGNNGVYSVPLSGDVAGDAFITVSINGTQVAGRSVIVTLTASVSAANSLLESIPPSIAADNVTTSTLRFSAKDVRSLPVTSLTGVTFEVSGIATGHYTLGSVSENNGVYSATLKGDTPGTAVVMVSINGNPVAGKATTVTLTGTAGVSAAQSALAVTPVSIPADNTTMSTVSFTAKETHGKLLTGLSAVTFDVSGIAASHVTLGQVTEKNGVYSTTLKGDVAGTAVVMVSVNGTPVAGKAAIVALTPVMDAAHSLLAAAPVRIPADNVTQTTLTFTARDSQDQPVTSLTSVAFNVSGIATGHFTLGPVTGSNGVYTATLQADLAGTATVSVSAGGKPVTGKTTTVILTQPVDAARSQLAAAPVSIPADNTTPATLTFTAKDVLNQPVKGLTGVSFEVSGVAPGHFTLGTVSEKNGIYSATLTGDAAGTAVIMVSVNGKLVAGKAAIVSLTDITGVSAADSLMSAAPARIPANNTTTTTLSFTARDMQKQPVTGLTKVAFDVVGLTAGHYTLGTVTEVNGVYRATLKGDMVGTAVVMVSVNGSAVTGRFVTVDMQAPVSAANSLLGATPVSIQADNTSTSTIKFTAKDTLGRLVTGLTGITFDVSGLTAGHFTMGSVTESNGVYSATLKGDVAGTATVMVNVNGQVMGGKITTVTLTPPVSAANSLVSVSPAKIQADNSMTSTLSVMVKDAQNQVITGLTTVRFTVSGLTAGHFTLGSVTESNGVYSATLKGDVAGTATITASVSGVAVAGQSGTVTLTRPVSGATSILVVSPASIQADNATTSTVSFTAKDAQGRLVTGLAASDLSFMTGATATTTVGTITENNGTYSFTIKGRAPATLVVAPMINGVTLLGMHTASVNITALPNPFVNITSNKVVFALGNGFPTTGSLGAKFTINTPDGPTRYTWTSSQPWVSVSAGGEVSFTGSPTSSTKSVTITAIQGNNHLSYTFALQKWFAKGSSNATFSNVGAECRNNGGDVPEPMDIAGPLIAKRVVGSLWGEWGNMSIPLFWLSTGQVALMNMYGSAAGATSPTATTLCKIIL